MTLNPKVPGKPAGAASAAAITASAGEMTWSVLLFWGTV
jgi:hypothetical protein